MSENDWEYNAKLPLWVKFAFVAAALLVYITPRVLTTNNYGTYAVSNELTAEQKWQALALRQSKVGDFVVTKSGDVYSLGNSITKKVLDGDTIFYETRGTIGLASSISLAEMAKRTARVVRMGTHQHDVLNICFFTGNIVTTVGPEAWTCSQ